MGKPEQTRGNRTTVKLLLLPASSDPLRAGKKVNWWNGIQVIGSIPIGSTKNPDTLSRKINISATSTLVSSLGQQHRRDQETFDQDQKQVNPAITSQVVDDFIVALKDRRLPHWGFGGWWPRRSICRRTGCRSGLGWRFSFDLPDPLVMFPSQIRIGKNPVSRIDDCHGPGRFRIARVSIGMVLL